MTEIILEDIKKAIKNYESSDVKNLTEQAIKKGLDPLSILDAFNEVLKEVGQSYQNGTIFLPELVGAASTVEYSMPMVVAEIVNTGKQIKSLGKVAIGTVFGDIHSIGKAMVATLLTAGGFTVIDLGINVKVEKFVSTVEEGGIDILAMSALLTTTAPQQEKVLDMLKKKNLRDKVKVIVGGGAITKEFAESIGADGYGPSAPSAVDLAKKMLVKS
jgi:methanogenic corrinoid protein MtbC1